MIRIIFIIISLIFFSYCQSNPKPIPPILKKLYSIKGSVEIMNLGKTNWIEINDLPVSFKHEGQQLIKTEKGLYLTIPGTGRVYNATIDNDKINFIRIDSTYFSGYNFNCLNFNIENNIYSFGGEGFWHINGDLRKFDFRYKEWNAMLLNKSVYQAFNHSILGAFFHYVNPNNKTLIIDGSPNNENYIKNRIIDSANNSYLFELEIEKGEWETLGRKNFKNITELAKTPFGILSYEKIIDIEHNKIYNHNLNNSINSLIGNSTKDNYFSISFCVDSTIYFGNEVGRFDSLTITHSNLIDQLGPAFIPTENKSPILSKESLLTLALIGTSLLSLLLLFKKHLKFNTLLKNNSSQKQPEPTNYNNSESSNDTKTENTSLLRSGKLVDLLNDEEISFLSFLYDHSIDERMTTIDEINKKLGTSKRSIEIQKRMRSDMINGINTKLSTFSKSNKLTILKQRSEFDKRSFEYFINHEKMELVKNIIPNGNL